MTTPQSLTPRIEDYGLIGDMRTSALVGKDGSLDFLCWPKFDSPSIFCRLLDTTNGRGGHWSIKPRHEAHYLVCKQHYRASSNILQTKFIHETGVVDVTDFFALSKNNKILRERWSGSTLVRKIDCVRGSMVVDVELCPQPGYGLENDEEFQFSDVSFQHEGYQQRLYWDSRSTATESELDAARPEFFAAYRTYNKFDSKPRMFQSESSTIGLMRATFEMREGQQVYMIMCNSCVVSHLTREIVLNLERETYTFWTDWIRSCLYRGRFQQEVERSMLILKLLTYDPTGAIVAAPTFSLPEAIGGARNWDYRYSWVRDSSFTVYVFLKMGFAEEAEAYINFIFERISEWKQLRNAAQRQANGVANMDAIDGEEAILHLPLMFSIDGHTDLPEKELDHLGGYMDSRPVRIGNAATGHVQLDIYGELMDAIYLYNKHGAPISYRQWLDVRELIDFVCTVVKEPDMSIWEVRGQKMHFVYSKIMLWVAIDRGIRLAWKRNFPAPNRDFWLKTKDLLYEEVLTQGFNEKLNTFIQAYESKDALDSAVLIAPLVFFISPNDPQFIGTLEAILKTPEKGGLTSAGFVFRYDTNKMDDGVGGKEGTFMMCTLWLIEALVRAGKYERKYLERATGTFELVTNFRNHLGMLSEEIALSGEQLGNTPQAFSHLAYVSAAINLERVTRELKM